MQFKTGHKTEVRRQRAKGAYILAYRCRRKNAKRHIIDRYDDLDECKRKFANFKAMKGKHWDIHIYNYIWELIE